VKIRIHVIDDNRLFLREIEGYFADLSNRRMGNCQIDDLRLTACADDGLRFVEKDFPEIVIANTDMQTGSCSGGFELVKAIRERNRTGMIIAVGGSQDGSRAVPETGSDRYLCTPVTIDKLIPVIADSISAYQHSFDPVLRLGAFDYFPARSVVRIGGTGGCFIRLPRRENNLLRHLVVADRPVGKGELLAEVWGFGAKSYSHTVETHVHRLRKRLSDAPDFLMTSAEGYYLET